MEYSNTKNWVKDEFGKNNTHPWVGKCKRSFWWQFWGRLEESLVEESYWKDDYTNLTFFPFFLIIFLFHVDLGNSLFLFPLHVFLPLSVKCKKVNHKQSQSCYLQFLKYKRVPGFLESSNPQSTLSVTTDTFR